MPNINRDSISCPSCHGHLKPAVLTCSSCHIRIEGSFSENEFASLSTDDLHFLRIFIHCEGRIRDMEAALGMSYPTVKNRLTAFKRQLGLETPAPMARHEKGGQATPTEDAVPPPTIAGQTIIPQPPATPHSSPKPAQPAAPTTTSTIQATTQAATLDALASGKLSFEDALKRLQGLSKKE